ncbi:phage antirepressor [Streptomyces griseofuscus]|uniref:phage antirepressor n=1 Tax=Streptomyces griseofuscus TaxID=146922 RepID=UPI0036CDB136
MIEKFNYNGAEVRTVIKDGGPWFVAKDVCAVLEIGNPSQALTYLDEDEKSHVNPNLISNEVGRGGRAPLVVNEPGLYSLILRSRKPEARQFKRWVTHEVLPTIRKTGGYAAPGIDLTDPAKVIEIMQASIQAYEVEKAKREHAELVIENQAPKVEIADRFIDSAGSYSWDEVARAVDLGKKKLLERLRLSAVLMDGTRYCPRTGAKLRPRRKHNLPFQRYENLGWFDLKTKNHYTDPSTGKEYFDTDVFVTPRGLDGIRKILCL